MDWYLDPTRPGVTGALRQELKDYLQRHADSDDEVYSALLATEELVSNALRHGRAGPVWVTVDWPDEELRLGVHDLGPGFDLSAEDAEEQVAAADTAEGGRGLLIASVLATRLEAQAKRAGGTRVEARIPLRRRPAPPVRPPTPVANPLPSPEEAGPDGYGMKPFLRALVVQLAQAVEASSGPVAAESAVAQVGATVGEQMEAEFRHAHAVVERLSADEVAACYVRLKAAINGGFRAVEVSDERIVLVNTRCPFGLSVRRAPSLCRMTSAVFGGIAARRSGEATVVLEERIAVGDPGCRVVVHLGPVPPDVTRVGHRYVAQLPTSASASRDPVSRS